MPEHFTKSTVEASVWCRPCGKFTPHRIDDGRHGACLECLAKLNQPAKQEEKQPEQLTLMGVYGSIDIG